MTSVAVAVNGGTGVRGKGSRRAVRWAAANLLSEADRFILVHVMPTITSIPTPSGGCIPVEEVEESVVKLYVEEVKVKIQELFVPFKKLCGIYAYKVETLVLEEDDPAMALVKFVSEMGISSLVLGSCFSNCILRKLRGPGVPRMVLKHAPGTFDIHIAYRYKVVTKSASLPSIAETTSRQWKSDQSDVKNFSGSIKKQNSDLYSSSERTRHQKSFEASSVSNLSPLDSQAFDYRSSTLHNRSVSTASTRSDQSYVQVEIEQLRLELQNTVAMYKQACDELVRTQSKVQILSSEYAEETKKVNAALEREDTLKKIAAEEKSRYLKAVKEVENAKSLLTRETYDRQIAELNALKESLEKRKLVDALFTGDKRYRRYTRDEIEMATDYFSESNVIGEGGYGKVYKCNLDHIPVAIKVLHSDAVNKKEEFLREVEVLSQLRHPNMVLLLGACPESGCLVYEYLENGSLEDCLFQKTGKQPLPWFVRFRIVFEVACGLAFLHNSKPDPIVHRDLKPGNILLDRNYMSKIGDVGLAKLILDVVPDNMTEYRDSIIAGTLFYMDPEYQRTGTVRPKSDLYAFGVIILQVLTARRPKGLLSAIEKAIKNGCFADILDRTVTDWPLAETEELAQIALKCTKLRCRDRPDLDTEVLPALRKLVDVAAACVKVERSNIYAPKHYFCPILQEIMEDPYVAADGFTYEHRAIKAWLEKHNVSPATKRRLQHNTLTPNHALRSAIQEWRSLVNFQLP